MVNNLDLLFQFKDMGNLAFRFSHINTVYKVSVYNLNAVFHDKYKSKKIDTNRLT